MPLFLSVTSAVNRPRSRLKVTNASLSLRKRRSILPTFFSAYGLELARGEYVGILEPDDYVPLDMFEELYRTASENDLDFVKADFYRFSTEEDGSMNLVYNHLDDTGKYYDRVLDPSRTPELIKLIMNTWSGIYRRAFLREHSIRHNTTQESSVIRFRLSGWNSMRLLAGPFSEN